jgi:hypothetical protein
MKVLITGATGFVGKALAKALHEKGHEVSALSRNPEKAKERLPFLKNAFRWNWRSEDPPLAAFKDCDAVINLAGENISSKRWTESEKKEIFDSRVRSTEKLVSVLKKIPHKLKVFISTSAVGFYGDRGEEVLTESSPLGWGFLPNLTYAWEEEARKIQKFGIRTVILRLGVVLGKNGGMLKKIPPIFKLGLGGPLGNGKQWLSWIRLEDLVDLFQLALEKNSMEGVYNAVSPSPVTNSDFTEAIGKLLNRPTFLKAPRFALKLFLGQVADELLLASQKVSAEKILKAGFTFKYPEINSALKNSI